MAYDELLYRETALDVEKELLEGPIRHARIASKCGTTAGWRTISDLETARLMKFEQQIRGS